ncbi:heterokaryon incompatibility protein-domain-containing protein [Neurospora hispaniola]|uniref:Heterokaryon incompatibility protein-domain-containing protein n=1 Tax=Neurospora hispaniola TaxID=588809 RepID=A0AAJ0MR30_9PEZI|nr:heterokaryon incompatibility protein-domain-containing protein [Neurospora hispaniola]
MADKKVGPNVGFDEKNSNLCSTCRKVDFKSLFWSHDCEVDASLQRNRWVNCDTHRPKCRLLGKLNSQASGCSFCAFLYQCQVRLNLSPTKQEHWRCSIRPECSLEDFLPKLRKPSDPFLQDVAILQIWKVQLTGSGRFIQSQLMPQPILRVVDSSSKTLIRNKRAGGGLQGRKLDPNKVNLNLIEQWLTLCRSTHSHCEDVDAGRIPGLLVIDCTTNHVVPLPLRQEAADQVANYVTLSYLWGTAEATGGSVVQSINCDGVSVLALPTQIPLVISDAIRVVKQLGYRYLWVDRYCIPQEDGAAKHIQILNMGRIYSNSILTIIAAAGDEPEYGLPGCKSTTRFLVLYESPTDHITNSKWNTRGWTYQEGLLSKRRLVFTDLMVYFQCQEMHGDEVLSLPIPEPGEGFDAIRPLLLKKSEFGMVFPKVTDWDDPFTAWDRISEYGPRELGHDSDALNAISGVMEMYALAAGDSAFKLFCGLPVLSIRSWAKYDRLYSEPQALNFRTSFEDADAFKEAFKAQRTDDNNLTFSLAFSLCWSHGWRESFDLPASFERARRKVFCSWTTAGWRTRKVKPRRINLFDSCLRIRVQYSGELLLNWEDDNPRILDLSRNGKIPLSLNITGLVMDVQMVWQEHPLDPDEDGWVITRPFETSLGSPQWLFEEAVSGKGDCSKLLFLIVGCDYELNLYEPLTLSGMILRPVTRSSEGEVRTFYERLNSCLIEVSKDDWPRLASLTREMEVRLI